MKKNITINLFGTLYAIDEDACNLLEAYLKNMRSYFGKREGGDEIADDIEHRVAELLSELREQGVEAVNIEHVQGIIARIGDPEQMDDESAESAETPNEQTSQSASSANASANASASASASNSAQPNDTVRRRLYRNPDDRMLGGVISGICQYFGGLDPLPFRILTCLLLFFSFSTVGIVYLVAWIIVPEARTAEERLQMKGKPVNPQSINEEILNNMHRATNYVKSPGFQKTAKSFWGTCLSIIIFCFKVLMLLILVLIMFMLVVLFIFYIIALTEAPGSDNLAFYFGQSHQLSWFGAMGLLCGFVGIGLGIYCVLFRMFSAPKQAEGKRSVSSIVITVVSLLAVMASIAFSTLFGTKLKVIKQELERKEGTVNGIYVDKQSNQVLSIDGWSIEKVNNCNGDGDFYSYTNDFLNEDQMYYRFLKDDERKPMSFSMKRTENLPEGDYRVETLTAIEGPGAFIAYGANADSLTVEALPSQDKNEQGNLCKASYEEVKSWKIFADSLNKGLWLAQCQEVDDWSFQQGKVFHHQGGPLTIRFYGTLGRGADEAALVFARVVKAE